MGAVEDDSRAWGSPGMGWPLGLSVVLHGLVLLLPYQGGGYAAPAVMSVTFETGMQALQAAPASPVSETAGQLDMSGEAARPEPASAADQETSFGLIPSSPITPLPPVVYHAADRLTQPPRIDVPPVLDSPELEAVGGTGVVALQLWISNQGRVVEAMVVRTDLPEAFGKHTINAFRNARFHPGELDGVAVRSLMRIEVSYEVRRTR